MMCFPIDTEPRILWHPILLGSRRKRELQKLVMMKVECMRQNNQTQALRIKIAGGTRWSLVANR